MLTRTVFPASANILENTANDWNTQVVVDSLVVEGGGAGGAGCAGAVLHDFFLYIYI